MFKKIVASAIVLSSIVSYSVTNADTYKEISCSTDKVFSENSCDQCFEGWEKSELDDYQIFGQILLELIQLCILSFKKQNYQKWLD